MFVPLHGTDTFRQISNNPQLSDCNGISVLPPRNGRVCCQQGVDAVFSVDHTDSSQAIFSVETLGLNLL